MTEQQERAVALPDEVVLAEPQTDAVAAIEEAPRRELSAPPAAAEGPSGEEGPGDKVDEARRRHAEAGRKGAHRVHQLIQEGKLYEQEHGLKSGRQRLRQLIELGKLYEQEHGLLPVPGKKRRERLGRTEREELLATLLQCLLRIVKPSFRAELLRLVEALQEEKQGRAA